MNGLMNNQPMNQRLLKFYQDNCDDLYGYAMSIVSNPDDAQDLVQLGLLKLADLIKEKGDFPRFARRYIFGCIRNAGMDIHRRKQIEGRAAFQLRNMINREVATGNQILLSECFNQLSENQRETIILRDIIGYTYREIASIKGVSLFTVASWYRRGMKCLGKLVEEETGHESK